MQVNAKSSSYLPLVIIFMAVSLIILGLKLILRGDLPFWPLSVANLLLFLASLVSFRIYLKGLFHRNIHVFLRMIYGGMFLKMVLCLGAVAVYVFVSGPDIHRGVIFAGFGFYVLYTVAEVSILMRRSKVKHHVQEGSPT